MCVCVYVCRLWVLVTSSTPLKVYLFDGGVVIFGSVLKQRSAVDLPADDEVSYAVLKCMSRCTCMSIAYEMCMSCFCAEVHVTIYMYVNCLQDVHVMLLC